MSVFRAVKIGVVCTALLPLPALANGFGEATGFQFRSAADRQILLLQEQTRLNFKAFDRSALGSIGDAGIGQTGNESTINIIGDNNTIDLNQDNLGDQFQQAIDGNNNTTDGDQVPVENTVSEAADLLRDIE